MMSRIHFSIFFFLLLLLFFLFAASSSSSSSSSSTPSSLHGFDLINNQLRGCEKEFTKMNAVFQNKILSPRIENFWSHEHMLRSRPWDVSGEDLVPIDNNSLAKSADGGRRMEENEDDIRMKYLHELKLTEKEQIRQDGRNRLQVHAELRNSNRGRGGDNNKKKKRNNGPGLFDLVSWMDLLLVAGIFVLLAMKIPVVQRSISSLTSSAVTSSSSSSSSLS